MIYLLNNKRVKTIRSVPTEEFIIRAIGITEDESIAAENDVTTLSEDEILELYGVEKKDILYIGKCDTIPYSFLDFIIPHKLQRSINSISIHDKNLIASYKCVKIPYEHFVKTHTIIHYDRSSAWNCIVEYLGNPEFVIIFKDGTTSV